MFDRVWFFPIPHFHFCVFFHYRIKHVVVKIKYARYFHRIFWLSFLPEHLLERMKK